MRLVLVLAAIATMACANNPPPAVDAGTTADSGPCTPACTGGQLCCPVALSYGCLPPTGAGVCPVPDLSVDQGRASSSARVVWQYFSPEDCAVVEECIVSPGWRRLLRFDTYTPNVGTGDFRMGPPESHPELFQYSACHMHYHFNGYANYTLLDSAGATAAVGHKQAFCLEDYEQNVATASPNPTYDCSNQGISVGWGDLYGSYLDCQWIDVTDVAPGDYTIRIDINGGVDAATHLITEITYTNNTAMAPVTIVADDPTADPTAACASGIVDGYRDCGWTDSGTFDCTAGATVNVGCGGGCGVGSCTGDAVMRICPDSTPCLSHTELALGDDECGGTGDDACPGASFTCPASGHYTVLTAPYQVGDAATCSPAAGASL